MNLQEWEQYKQRTGRFAHENERNRRNHKGVMYNDQDIIESVKAGKRYIVPWDNIIENNAMKYELGRNYMNERWEDAINQNWIIQVHTFGGRNSDKDLGDFVASGIIEENGKLYVKLNKVNN